MDQQWQKIANLVFELDRKSGGNPALGRICEKMKNVVEEAGVFIYDPSGEKYTETRTDVEGSITGNSMKNLVISEVIKPILYKVENNSKTLVQRGVVIVSDSN